MDNIYSKNERPENANLTKKEKKKNANKIKTSKLNRNA